MGKVKFGAKKAPSLVGGALAVGNLATTEAVKILLGFENIKVNGTVRHLLTWLKRAKILDVDPPNTRL